MRLPAGINPIRELPSKRAWVITALVVAVIAAALGGARLFEHFEIQREAERKAAAENLVKSLVLKLQEVLRPELDAMGKVAEDPRVIAALSGADDALREQLATTLQTSIPHALRLRLIPRGMRQTDPDATPPLTYASLDLLLKAEQSDKPPGAELHLAGTPQEHVAMVARVPSAGEPVGFIHLALDAKAVRAAVAGVLQGASDPVEVRQPILGAPPVSIATSRPLTGSATDAALSGIPGTSWMVAVRHAAATPGESAARESPGLLPYAALAVLGLAGFALWRRRTRTTEVVETTVYTGAIRAILDGQHPALAALVPGLNGTRPMPPKPAAPDAGPPTIEAPAFDPDITAVQRPPELAVQPVGTSQSESLNTAISPSIFRSYDIRGVVGTTLTIEAVYQIGRAFGSEAAARNQATVIVARDGRTSSVMLRGALVEGLRDSGRDVLDIGLVPTPVLYFATHDLDAGTGIMVTGSHNPAEYNGLKMVLDGETLSGDAIQAIRRRIEEQDFITGTGTLQEIEIVPDYIRRISEDIPVSLGTALKVVVDCGNGVPGIVAPHILRAIGHDVIELFCEVDGDFPNHHPDPSQPENLEDLIAIVRHENADLGLAFDGDGDRLGVVDREGNIIWPDRQMMLFAQDILSRNPGAKIIYDVKCSRRLAEVITAAGGEPIMAKTGHSLIKSKMKETGALLAGEMSGHIFFKERWYGFDDALYSAARLLEILVNANEPPEQVFARLPQSISTPELRLEMPEARHAEFMQQVIEKGDFADGTVTQIDGLRVDYTDSWGLIRASNTTPCLVLRFEGDTNVALQRIKERFRQLLLGIDPTLVLPF